MTSKATRYLAALFLLVFAGCDDGGSGQGGDVNMDADTDVDSDSDTDSDSDSDTDSDSNSDTDADSEVPATCDGTALTQWEQMMLDAHNEWRAAVDPQAADMCRLYWDANIAANAAAWVSSCDSGWPHSSDESRSGVGGYEDLGENLSYCAGTGCPDNPSVTDGSGRGGGESWWRERLDYNWQDGSNTGPTSHYTQMVSSNVYAIGCATQRCDPPGPGDWSGEWWWTICQYGPRGQAYWSGTGPYDAGQGGLVEPPATVFADHPGLCGAP